MQMQKYSIVEFNEENTVEIIPSSWISFDKKTTLWPNTISPAILKKYLKNNTEPNDDWTSVHIRILGHAGIDFLFLIVIVIFLLSCCFIILICYNTR